MNISIIIPSYNAQENLPNTLKALAEQQTTLLYEVIVVDCSESDAVQNICADFSFVKFHHEATRFNPGKGRNIGAQIASGDLMIFVDADVVLAPKALEAAWQFYQQGNRIFGGALELNEEVSSTTASYLEHYFFNHESQKGRPVFPRSNLSSALMAFDRETFIGCGGFKDIPRMQDTELTERLLRSGEKLMFTPDLLGLQIQDSPMKKVMRKIYINGKNLYFIRYAHKSKIKKIILFLLLPFVSGFKIIRILARHMRYQTTPQKLKTFLISPLFAIGGLYWMAGLYHSMIVGSGIGKERD